MSKLKLIRILSSVLLVGVLVVEGLSFWLVQQLNMLPAEYLVLLAAFLLLLWVILAALLFVPGRKKRLPGMGRTIVIALLVICVLLGCGAASKMVIELKHTLDSVSKPAELTAYVDVFVRADDPAQTVEDAVGYTFAITEYYDIENTRKALEQLEAKYNTKINTLVCPHVYGMADALYSGQVDAMLINTVYISILEESEGYTDFMTRTKLLEQLDIRHVVENPKPSVKNPFDWILGTPDDPTEPNQQTDPVQEETGVKIPDGKLTETPFVVYLAGCDYKGKGLGVWSRNDVNILAVVNPTTRQILLINTPRDYYIPNPAGNGALDKLTHCGVKKVDNSVLALSQFYEVPIRYYAQIGFDGVKGLVDAVDGVTVYSDVSYTALGTVQIQKGMNYLNGEQALAFARERKNIDGGDNARGNNQMKIIKAVVDKMISGKLITKYTDILRSIRGLFRTNMTSEEMAALVEMQLSDMRSWNIVSYAVTGEAAYSWECYEMPGKKAFVYIPNMDTVEYAQELMQRVVDGEILEQKDIIPAE